MITLRPALAGDINTIAQIWHVAWHEAHAEIVSPELVKLRAFESFHPRIETDLSNITVGELNGVLSGFVTVRGDELHQLFVAAEARGTGLARALVQAAEEQISSAGHDRAWLDCAVGNDPAAGFYRSCGWEYVRTHLEQVETQNGPFGVDCWVFEKALIA
ncbi:MAG: GNAT family N-acetyltransferase [Pseudomonadota bacterium]